MSRKTFTSRNRAFAALVRGRDNIIVTNTVDSAGAVKDIVDSAYIAARTTAGTDSAAIINLIDSAYVSTRAGGGGGGGGGGTITEVTDSSTREAISSPLEGDIAVQFQMGPGVYTGITNNYSGGAVMTYSGGSGTTYNNGQQTFTSSVFAPHAQVGDVIVVENTIDESLPFPEAFEPKLPGEYPG